MLSGSIQNDIKHQFRYGNMVVKLIFVNVAVFLSVSLFALVGFLFQSNDFYAAFLKQVEIPASLSRLVYQPWSVFTYMFLHTGFFHLLFNMLWFYWFGEIFVLYLGDKKILPLYLLGGVVGALMYLLAFNLIPVFTPSVSSSYMLGASASIFAVVFAAATIAPDYEIRLLFIGSVRIKYVALFSLLLDIINIPNGNAGGYIAHIGGAIAGYVFIRALQNGIDFSSGLNQVFDFLARIFQPKSTIKVSYKSDTKNTTKKARNKDDQQRVDEILDKIAGSGYDSLSKQEKDFLFNYSRKE